MPGPYSCVIHGSYRRHFAEIQAARRAFEKSGLCVLAPDPLPVVGMRDGFALLSGQETADPRAIELEFLHRMKQLGRNGFSYFVCPDGYLGKSAAYELGLAHALNVPCFFSHAPQDLPAYFPTGSVWRADRLAAQVAARGIPRTPPKRRDRRLEALWEGLVVPSSVVAAGAIIESAGPRGRRDILLVRTHKWRDRWSIVGGKLRRNELLKEALLREVREETGLRGAVGPHLCTFDQLRGSGYHDPAVHHLFVDFVVRTGRRTIRLNDEAEDSVWLPADIALRDLPLEPNARRTVQTYLRTAATT